MAMSAMGSPGGQRGKLEPCGDDGKLWEQLHWKATLVRREQPEGQSPLVFQLLSPSPGVSQRAGEMWDSARVGHAGLTQERAHGKHA